MLEGGGRLEDVVILKKYFSFCLSLPFISSVTALRVFVFIRTIMGNAEWTTAARAS